MRPRSRHIISPETNPVLDRLWRECIWRAEQMNVIRHDDVATNPPEICRLPCRDDQPRCFVVREQRSSPVRAHGEEDNYRSEPSLDCRKMRRFLPFKAARNVRRRRRAPPSVWVCLHACGFWSLASPASNIRMRLSMNGKRIVRVRPLPWLLSMESSPPCSRTIRRTINNPSPLPDGLVVK